MSLNRNRLSASYLTCFSTETVFLYWSIRLVRLDSGIEICITALTKGYIIPVAYILRCLLLLDITVLTFIDNTMRISILSAMDNINIAVLLIGIVLAFTQANSNG